MTIKQYEEKIEIGRGRFQEKEEKSVLIRANEFAGMRIGFI